MTFPAQRPAPGAPPYPTDPFTATRHLCAAAYLDETFRDDSLREVFYQPRRLVAPSYGFDLVPVLGHCLRSRNGATFRDAAIVATFLVAACFSWVAVLWTVTWMVNLQVIVASYRLVRDMLRRLRNGETLQLLSLLPRTLMLAFGWALLFSASGVLISALARQAASSFFEGGTDAVESTASAALLGSSAITVLIFAYPITFSLWRQSVLAAMTPGSEVTMPVRNSRLDEISRQQRGNTVVYSGFDTFVGAGELVKSWGFAQRLVRPEPSAADVLTAEGPRHAAGRRISEREREFAVPPFTAEDLLGYVRTHLGTMLSAHRTEERIDGLTVEDRVFLAGTEVSELSPHTPAEMMSAVIRHPTTPARHYLVCQVFAWGGELITTVYVHVAVQGRSLYLELNTAVLPPTAELYRIVDTVENTGAMPWLRALKNGFLDTPRIIWRAPGSLTRALINLVVSNVAAGNVVPLTRGFDYGARVGVREMASPGGARNLVQIRDVEKYRKLIERRVIASVLDFLDERGVDTTEYRARATSVLNINSNNRFDGGINTVGGDPTFNGPTSGGNMTGGGSR